MPIPVEVFSSENGVFVAAPKDCELFDAPVLTLSRKARVLCAGEGSPQAVTARLPPAALDALSSVTVVALAAFALGGVVRATIIPLRIEE